MLGKLVACPHKSCVYSRVNKPDQPYQIGQAAMLAVAEPKCVCALVIDIGFSHWLLAYFSICSVVLFPTHGCQCKQAVQHVGAE